MNEESEELECECESRRLAYTYTKRIQPSVTLAHAACG